MWLRGHHSYQSIWASTVGENLFTAQDKWENVLSYDEFAIGVYKNEKCSLLAGHLPIEISNLSYQFLKKSSENKIIVKITGKREREIGLVVPANFVFITKDKNCSIILEAELENRKTLFKDLKLKFYKRCISTICVFPLFHSLLCPITSFTCACAKRYLIRLNAPSRKEAFNRGGYQIFGL